MKQLTRAMDILLAAVAGGLVAAAVILPVWIALCAVMEWLFGLRLGPPY